MLTTRTKVIWSIINDFVIFLLIDLMNFVFESLKLYSLRTDCFFRTEPKGSMRSLPVWFIRNKIFLWNRDQVCFVRASPTGRSSSELLLVRSVKILIRTLYRVFYPMLWSGPVETLELKVRRKADTPNEVAFYFSRIFNEKRKLGIVYSFKLIIWQNENHLLIRTTLSGFTKCFPTAIHWFKTVKNFDFSVLKYPRT